MYQSVKQALEEGSQQVWRLTTRNWMYQLLENKAFYMNAFQSVSQKEFQRMIRDFFYGCYKWQIEQHRKKTLSADESFVLRMYLFGVMESVYEWIAGGMIMPVEHMVDLMEQAMPEMIQKWVLSSADIPYMAAVKKMEEYLSEEGLLQTIS